MSSLEESLAIGIDLGTTYSCVGVFQNGKVEIIANDQGNKTTPSYVAFTENELFVGDPAKMQGARNHENTIFDVKRLIGRQYDDPSIKEDLQDWPFKVLNLEGKPVIEVSYKGENKRFCPEQISAMVLEKMKKTAEDYLGHEVRNAVITVPAYFSDSQRQATKDAGSIAGLNVLRIGIEPTVAALAYGLDKNLKGKKNILIYDLGGGTFDVSILTIEEGKHFGVKAIAGNTHLGGLDFDKKMLNHFVEEFKRKFKKDLRTSPKALSLLKDACERAKRTLSSCSEAYIDIDPLFQGIAFTSKISRAKFENLCLDLFKSTLTSVKMALNDAKMSMDEIHDIVLVGGSTRIPKIQNLLKNFFGGKELCKSVHPDEAVAYGAAIQAASLNGDQGKAINDVLLVEVAPLSLGTSVKGGVMSVIIERNTSIPAKASKSYYTVEDNQSTVLIDVFEGERAMVRDNHFLGKFELTGISPAPKGVPEIVVTFSLDENGILHASAREESSGKQNSIKINMDKGRLSKEEIDRMVAEAERFRQDDAQKLARLAAKKMLEDYAYDVRQAMEAASDKELAYRKRELAIRKCNEVLDWLEDNNLAEKGEFEGRLSDLHSLCNPFMKRHFNS